MNRTSLSFRALGARPRPLDTPCPAPRPGRVSPAAFPSGRPLPSTTSAPGTRACSAGSQVLRARQTSRVVHHGITASAFPSRPRPATACYPANHPGRGINHHQRATARPPGSRAWSLRACLGSLTPRGPPTARENAAGRWPSASYEASAPRIREISRLNSPPTRPLPTLRRHPREQPTHDSGPP